MFELSQLRRDVGDFSLRIDALRLEKGEIYALAGPNGCGKSTLLNVLALLDPPSGGTVVFDGVPVNYADARALLKTRRRIGYLMQNPYLFNMRVRDNVGFGLKARGEPREAVREKVDAMLARLALSHLAGRNAHALSGGEAQRVALARTFVIEADAYLLDEPTGNVDQRNIRATEEIIVQLSRERGATVVFATHSRDQAYRMSKRLISIIGGRIHDVAYENVLNGLLTEHPDGLRTVELPGGLTFTVSEGAPGQVTLAVDPREILLSLDRLDSSALNGFCGTVTKIEGTDETVRVFVDVGTTLCAAITRHSLLAMGLNVGKRVWVTFKATAVKVL
ncbi:MAG: ABC transporter ATP-binding protein [Kiritimatiellae bacterium]|nr:ABC transporter ATP-binding protein [Kiritimatiellia bacterium]